MLRTIITPYVCVIKKLQKHDVTLNEETFLKYHHFGHVCQVGGRLNSPIITVQAIFLLYKLSKVQNEELLQTLIFKKGEVTRVVHGKEKARVYYLSYCIVLTYSDWPKRKILTDPAIQEKATKDRTLAAIILWIKELAEYLYQ